MAKENDNIVAIVFFMTKQGQKKMTTLLPLSSSQQHKDKITIVFFQAKTRLKKSKRKRREGAYLQPRAFATRLKLQAPLRLHFPKLPCISKFLTLPWSSDDGGEKKEVKLGGGGGVRNI